jgi:hypothetical protein
MRAVVIAIVAALLTSGAYCQPETEEFIGVADTLIPDFEHTDWATSPGVYLVAPNALRQRMETAVAAATTTRELLCLREATCSWLAAGAPLLFLRAVSGSGRPSMDGFVCPRPRGVPVLRYYSATFIERGLCLPLLWNAETRTYDVSE